MEVVLDYPSMTVMAPTGTVAGSTTYPNYNATTNGQLHGSGFTQRKQSMAQLYLEVIHNGNVLGTKLIRTVSAYSENTSGNYYTGTVTSGGGGGGGDSPDFYYSVVGSTKITLPDGSRILAKDVRQGEKILAWNWNDKLEGSIANEYGEFTINEIKKAKVSKIYKVSAGGNTVKVSNSHGFWLNNNEQILATELVAGESMINIKDGNGIKLVLVDYIEIIETDEYVYTFEVPGVHNYISDNIISHNPSSWNFVFASTNSTTNGSISAASSQTITIPISQTQTGARLRYVVKVSVKSGYAFSTNASGTKTIQYDTNEGGYDITTSPQGGYLVGFSPDTSIVVSNPANFVEIKAGGIQVVSDAETFVRIVRHSQENFSEIFRAQGGISYFAKDADASASQTAATFEGNILAADDSQYNIGKSGVRFAEVWTDDLNGIPIQQQLIAACYFTVGTTGTISVANSTNITSVTRQNAGEFTINLTNTAGSSAALGFATGYGRNSNSYAGPGRDPGDSEFTFNCGVKVNFGSVNVNTKDNNNDDDRDPYRVYFVLFNNV